MQQLFLKAHTGQLKQANYPVDIPNAMQMHSRSGPSMTSAIPQWQQWQTAVLNYPMSTNNQSTGIDMVRLPYTSGANHPTYQVPAFTQGLEYQPGRQHLFHPVGQYENWSQQPCKAPSPPAEARKGESVADSVGDSICMTNE